MADVQREDQKETERWRMYIERMRERTFLGNGRLMCEV